MHTNPPSLPDYDSVAKEVERFAAEYRDEPVTEATLANVNDLLAVCRATVRPPDLVARGYEPTICIAWGNLEVEVFADRVEVYRFFEGRTDIWDEEHQPGDAFSNRLMAELASVNASSE